MAPSPLPNMPALAASATECRIIGIPTVTRKTSPNKNCSVRVHGELVVSYVLRRVGAPQTTTLHHDLYDPDTFFGSYTACRDAIHGMLAQTPLLREFDLGTDNWEVFTPSIMASIIVGNFRHDMDKHGGVALGIRLGLRWTVTVRIVYSEPKAAVAYMPPWAECCCICMEDLAARAGAVRLPCSHYFHRGCILPWFYKVATCQVATCPMCRRGMGKYLVAATNTPMGKFPDLHGR
ncbi:unnamed protein product [Alopecurus aequalis]